MMRDVDQRLTVSQESIQYECNSLRDQLSSVKRDFEEERRSRESVTQAKMQELAAIDGRLQQALRAEQEARRDSEAKVFRTFDERTAALREEISRDGKTRAEAETALRQYIDVDIPK